jgi:hypothetical protein
MFKLFYILDNFRATHSCKILKVNEIISLKIINKNIYEYYENLFIWLNRYVRTIR